MYIGIVGYSASILASASAFSHCAAMSGVRGSSLLCERASLGAMRGLAATRTFVDMSGGLVCAADSLIPVTTEGTFLAVDDAPVCRVGTTCLVLSVPDGEGLTLSYWVPLPAETDWAGGEGMRFLICAGSSKPWFQKGLFG